MCLVSQAIGVADAALPLEDDEPAAAVAAEPTMMSKEARQMMLSGLGMQGLQLWKVRHDVDALILTMVMSGGGSSGPVARLLRGSGYCWAAWWRRWIIDLRAWHSELGVLLASQQSTCATICHRSVYVQSSEAAHGLLAYLYACCTLSSHRTVGTETSSTRAPLLPGAR